MNVQESGEEQSRLCDTACFGGVRREVAGSNLRRDAEGRLSTGKAEAEASRIDSTGGAESCVSAEW